MNPTPEEKEEFLQYIRDGNDRGTAAQMVNPEYTGTMFRSMCNPRSTKNYDPDFATAYDEAVEERGPLDPTREQFWSGGSRTTTPNGWTKAMHLTSDQLASFLDHVRDGKPAFAAAQQIDPPTSITQIHRRVAKDPEFAVEFRKAMEEGYSSYKASLHAEAARQAFAGDYRALRDQLIIHDEHVRGVLTTNRHEFGNLDEAQMKILLEKYVPGLSSKALDELIEAREKQERGALGPGEFEEVADDDDDGEGASGVREPRRPVKPRSGAGAKADEDHEDEEVA